MPSSSPSSGIRAGANDRPIARQSNRYGPRRDRTWTARSRRAQSGIGAWRAGSRQELSFRSWSSCPISGSSSMTAGAMANPSRPVQMRHWPCTSTTCWTSWVTNPPPSSPTVLGVSWPFRRRSTTQAGFGGSDCGSRRFPGWNSGPDRSGGGSRRWRPRPTRMPSPSGSTHRWSGTRRGGVFPKSSRRRGEPRAWPSRGTSSSGSVHPFVGRT